MVVAFFGVLHNHDHENLRRQLETLLFNLETVTNLSSSSFILAVFLILQS